MKQAQRSAAHNFPPVIPLPLSKYQKRWGRTRHPGGGGRSSAVANGHAATKHAGGTGWTQGGGRASMACSYMPRRSRKSPARSYIPALRRELAMASSIWGSVCGGGKGGGRWARGPGANDVSATLPGDGQGLEQQAFCRRFCFLRLLSILLVFLQSCEPLRKATLIPSR